MNRHYPRHHLPTVQFLTALALALVANTVFAMTAPTSGQLGYGLYDMFVNDTVQGPVGYAIATGSSLFGFVSIFRSWIMGVMGLVVGAGVGIAATLPTSFGLIL